MLKNAVSGLMARIVIGFAIFLSAQFGVVWYIVSSFQAANQTLSDQIGERISDASVAQSQRLSDFAVLSEGMRSELVEINGRLHRVEGWQNSFINISSDQSSTILRAINSMPLRNISVAMAFTNEDDIVAQLVRTGAKDTITIATEVGSEGAILGLIDMPVELANSNIDDFELDLVRDRLVFGSSILFGFRMLGADGRIMFRRIWGSLEDHEQLLEEGSNVVSLQVTKPGLYLAYLLHPNQVFK